MRVTISEEAVFAFVDELLARWNAKPKKYPFNRSDAIIPQNVIPAELRANKQVLATFYLWICTHMRGGLESLQAFNAYINIWRAMPLFFEPRWVEWHSPQEITVIYERFGLGWDKKNAGKILVENSKRLIRNWGGNPLNLLRGLDSYDEALRRIKNKRNKRELEAAGEQGAGFMGQQHKMVSLTVYFFDWEGWLRPRFPYPSPADIHNFRGGLNSGGIVVSELKNNAIRNVEKISAPWRAVIMKYIKVRRADPVEVADALWLFSLVMCGNSPLTITEQSNGAQEMFFDEADVPRESGVKKFLQPGYRKALEETCLVCPILERCRFAIPSRPYYSKGLLVMNERPRVEDYIDRSLLREPVRYAEVKHPMLFDD